MKEKIIGLTALFIGVLSFVDLAHPLNVGIYHLRPYFFPAFAIAFGWIELHGRGEPFKKKIHHSHICASVAVATILITLWLVTRK
jgi:hypothetical protein